MDNFAEQLVKRAETSSDKTRKTALLVVGILLTAALAGFAVLQLGSPITAFVGLLLAAGAGYGTFFMYRNSYIEYEYAFTNGELDIDKITGKTKRTSMVSAEVRSFTAFGKYDENMKETEEMTVVLASDNIAEHEYYADFTHAEHGKTRLIFAPDERMLENIRKSLPAALRLQK